MGRMEGRRIDWFTVVKTAVVFLMIAAVAVIAYGNNLLISELFCGD